ncbi:MAG: OmpH family outer membrane protein [Bacteroidota bacterium]|nr:OmpH family outer membrane protein [Bacteroidota bacterium]
MKKVSILIVLFLISSYIYSQRGVRIGYVDTEYILQNLSEYEETRDQLEEKADEWRREIENRFEEIENKKEALNAERLLLTDELIKEKEEEIEIERNEILDYQQKRFGPRGDLIIQRKQLIQPIQDQIFIAIKEIAKSRKYDFIFDKSADIVMLYSDRKFDISDQILRIITRTNNRKQLDSRREKREAEQEDKILVSDIETEEIQEIEEENTDNAKKPEKTLSPKELREKMLEERKQKILASRKVKDSTFTKNDNN